jgi:hypothetical protein
MGGVREMAAASSAAPCHCVGESATASIKKIKGALDAPLHSPGLEFTEVTLEDVVSFLQDEYEIPIVIDTPELDDVGIDPSEPVTVNLKNISLRSALRLMLSRIDLTYAIQDGVLLVTTPEKAETILITCIYDVRDMVGTSKDKCKQLGKTITKCIAKETWSVDGGSAELHFLQPGLMVVLQTQPVHDEIASLLRGVYELREVKVESSDATASASDPFAE